MLIRSVKVTLSYLHKKFWTLSFHVIFNISVFWLSLANSSWLKGWCHLDLAWGSLHVKGSVLSPLLGSSQCALGLLQVEQPGKWRQISIPQWSQSTYIKMWMVWSRCKMAFRSAGREGSVGNLVLHFGVLWACDFKKSLLDSWDLNSQSLTSIHLNSCLHHQAKCMS